MPSKTSASRTSSASTGLQLNAGNLILIILLLLALAAFLWSFMNYQQAKQKIAVLTDPNVASELNQKQTEELLAKIGKLIQLPSEKNPVVATINDVEVLAATQDFYKDAHNGDKLLVFQNTRKAIIYDEDDNKLVNVGPIFYTNDKGVQQAPPRVADRIEIELRNGTSNKGATLDVRDDLRNTYAFNITTLAKAAKTDYSGITLVDLTDGSKANLVADLQKTLGAQVVKELPAGESVSAREVVVIVGTKNN